MPTYAFTGAVQTYTMPVGITSVQVECWGAQGSNIGTGIGGLGGYAKGIVSAASGTVLNLYIGGQNGYNGGGAGANGGGGTDVRVGGTSLANRIICGGGGGGAGGYSGSYLNGGAGGGNIGSTGSGGAGGAGSGGTQSAGGSSPSGNSSAVGSLGSGGNGGGYGGGSGGGGYYGGGGGYYGYGGGGGSGYIGGVTSGSMQSGIRSGNGQVVITLLNALPTKPTGLTVSSSVLSGNAANVTWTHHDPDGDPQAKYKFKSRNTSSESQLSTIFAPSSNAAATVGLTLTHRGSFSEAVNLTAVAVKFYTAGTAIIQPVIWSDTGVKIAEGPQQIITVAAAGEWHDLIFTVPIPLTAGTVYRIGYYEDASSTASPGYITSSGAAFTVVSSPDFSTWSDNGTAYYTTGNAVPTSTVLAVLDIIFKSTASIWTELSPVTSSTQTGLLDTTGFTAGTYQLEVATADAQGFGLWSIPIDFNVVVVHAEIITAVPPVLNLVGSPNTYPGIASNLAAVPAGLSLTAVPTSYTVSSVLNLVPAVLNLSGSPFQINAGQTVYAVPVSNPFHLQNGGPITIYWNGLFAVSAGLDLYVPDPTRSVYIMPTRPEYTEMQYRARFLDPQTNITRRVEILLADGQTLWDDKYGNKSRLISGSVSVDYSRDERRSTDLELANFDKALIHKPDGFWYDKVLKLYRGIEFYDKSGLRSYEVPLGNFLMDKLDYARFPQTVKITARDFTKKCMLSKLTQAEFYPADTLIETLISALASNAGCHDRIIPTTGIPLGIDTTYERDKSRWEIMKEVSDSFGYELFFNAQGFLEMRPYLDPTLSPISYEFKTGPSTGNLVDWTESVNDTRIFNHVSVIGADSNSIPVWGDAYNNNPNSPTSIDNLGSERTQNLEFDFVTSNEQAAALAATYLAVNGLEEYEIDMSALVAPWLETGEIVQFTNPDASVNDPNRFLLTQLTIPLGLEPMSATGRRVMIVS